MSSAQSISIEPVKIARATRWGDYLELTKPRIATLELVVVAAAAFFAARGLPDGATLLATLLGTALVAASASAMNHGLERHSDGRMKRTADRPLPGGRISVHEVWLFGGVTLAAGLLVLASVGMATAGWALATWLTYVAIYTPLKRVGPINTTVGAVAGALPVLIGWSSVGRPLDLDAATLWMVLFLWQFPHFMAIAWLHRDDYAAAGMKMLTVVDPSGRRAGAQAIVAALAIIPVCTLPAVGWLEPGYFAAAAALAIVQCSAAAAFCWRRDELSARRLLRASLIFLPTWLILLALTPVI